MQVATHTHHAVTAKALRDNVPRHVAVVMDGNGRWAKRRFMPRFFGHKQGVDALVRTVQACADRGIEYLTVFAFSSENWKRPSEEVSGLMNLVLVAVAKYLKKLAEEGVQFDTQGRVELAQVRWSGPDLSWLLDHGFVPPTAAHGEEDIQPTLF